MLFSSLNWKRSLFTMWSGGVTLGWFTTIAHDFINHYVQLITVPNWIHDYLKLVLLLLIYI